MRSVPLVLLLALLLAPLAGAHIEGGRPVLQRVQAERIVGLEPEGLVARVDLSLQGDPLRQLVRHVIDPPRGAFSIEHREDASDAAEAFLTQWRLERLVEYRDLNVDGKFQPRTDTAVKAWRFTHYQWRVLAIQPVQVADVRATSIVWEGNLTGAPQIRLEVAFAGKDFTDEGAIVRPQDAALYLDFLDMPTRGLGSLYALEGSVTTRHDAALSFHTASNTSTALLSDVPLRRALFAWGGEALLDGREQRLVATMDEEQVGEDGNRTARFTLHLPTVDESMHFVLVSAMEYGVENKRAPGAGVALVVAAAVAVALAGRRR